MRRAWLLLIILIVFTTAFAFFGFNKTPPLFASNDLTLTQSGKLSVFTIQMNPNCDGSLWLYKPYEKLILTTLMPSEERWVEVGNFTAGQEIVFKLELDGSSVSYSGTFLSTDNDFGYLLSPRENLWYFIESQYLVMAVQLEPVAAPPNHPVIFIHGVGGYPTDWTTGDKRVYFDRLKVDSYNYPVEFLHAYEYADSDGNPETYDNQGDVTLIVQGLETEVNRLSELYEPGCTEDCVDIVGFSLGGIIAREYLNNHPTNHKVRKLITIASPHRGVWLFGTQKWAEMIPGIGPFMLKALNEVVSTVFQAIGVVVDLNSIAAQQVRPASSLLSTIFDNTNQDVQYDALYGDIDVEIKQKLFFFEFKKKVSVGDIFILPDSATDIPTENLHKFGFSDEPSLTMNVRAVETSTGSYEYLIDPLRLEDLDYYHGKLITQPDVVERVINLLIEE